jgi:hypothetical protein
MSKVEIRVAGKYKVGALRAVGSHSEVFEGVNTHSMEKIALKLEYNKAKGSVLNEA